MITLMVTRRNFLYALEDILELEYDMLETYMFALDKIQDQKYKYQLEEFKQDHETHIDDIINVFKQETKKIPKTTGGMQLLCIEGSAENHFFNDETILSAMIEVEGEVVAGYEYIRQFVDGEYFTTSGLEDGKRHINWLKRTVLCMRNGPA